jgi:tetratricopeptide (TPR) repeat protein
MTDINSNHYGTKKIEGFAPNFLGIGVAKAGTTSLSSIIVQHPEISLSRIAGKEIHYFDEKFLNRSNEWYFSLFEENIAVGEFTPSYIFVPECRDRIYDTLGPDVKFIVSLRNPVDRAYSHYCHAVNNWGNQKFRKLGYPVENLTFEKALQNEIWRMANDAYHIRHQSYFSKGLYAKQIKWYFKKFSKDNFYIYLLEDYAKNPENILIEICKFLDADPHFKFIQTNSKLNSQTNRAITPGRGKKLSAQYHESIEELEDLLNRDLSLWKLKPSKNFSTYTQKLFASRKDSVAPIFIVGSPRSGTTLLQCMLSVGDHIYSLPETHFFCAVLPSLKQHFNSKISSENFEDFIDKLSKKMELTWPQHIYEELNKKASNEVLIAKDLFSEILEIYRPPYDSTKLLRPIEKTPFHVFHLNDILECYPNAQFINIVRDVRDVVSSRILMPTAVYKSVIPYAHDWNRCIRVVAEFAKEYPEKILSVRYEDLVLKTVPTMQRLCQFLGIDFVKEMILKFSSQYESCTLHNTETWKEEVKTGEIRNKIGIWKKRLNPERAIVIEHIAQSEMKNCGYTVEESETKIRSLDILNKEHAFFESEQVSTGCIPEENKKNNLSDPALLNQRGEELFRKGDLSGALNLFNEAALADPSFSLAHNNLGVVYWQTQRREEAVELFIRALEMDPRSYNNVNNCYQAYNNLVTLNGTDQNSKCRFLLARLAGGMMKFHLPSMDPLEQLKWLNCFKSILVSIEVNLVNHTINDLHPSEQYFLSAYRYCICNIYLQNNIGNEQGSSLLRETHSNLVKLDIWQLGCLDQYDKEIFEKIIQATNSLKGIPIKYPQFFAYFALMLFDKPSRIARSIKSDAVYLAYLYFLKHKTPQLNNNVYSSRVLSNLGLPAERALWYLENFADISQFRDKHNGESCFIIGNGPSLREMDLSPLRHRIAFGLNKIHLLFDKLGFETTYLAAANPYVIQQAAKEISNLSMPRFIMVWGREFIQKDEKIIFLRENRDQLFVKDITEGVCIDATVTYMAMQIAYYMGFKTVVLIGVDHYFESKGQPHATVQLKGEDPNHFDPNYFGHGLPWQLPDLEGSDRAYQRAKKVFEADGRIILDATVGGKLQVFDKISYKEALDRTG